MKKIRLTEEDLHKIIVNSAMRIVEDIMDKKGRDVNYDEDGIEIPGWEDDMYDARKNKEFNKANSWLPQQGEPEGWQKLYLKARRHSADSIADKMRGGRKGEDLERAWTKALAQEYPNMRERGKAFNDFSKRIDKFRGYKPHPLDKVPYGDPKAPWNSGRRNSDEVDFSED